MALYKLFLKGFEFPDDLSRQIVLEKDVDTKNPWQVGCRRSVTPPRDRNLK